MANILDIVPNGISERFKQLFEVFEEIYHEKTNDAIEKVKNIYNTQYALPEGIVDMLLNLFGFYVSDLKFFGEDQREKIKNDFVNNIFVFYKERIKKQIFIQLLYMYGVRGNVYMLDTHDWTSFLRAELGYLSINKYTDIGLKTDMNYKTDNLHRTPFVEIEILLDTEYINKLWYVDLNDAIKKDIENIKYILSKIFYTLRCDLIGEENGVINNDNGVDVTTTDITSISDVDKCRTTFTDLSTDTFMIKKKEEGVLLSDEKQFEINMVAYTSCTTVNNKAFIAYHDVTDSSKGKFVIYDENGNEFVAPTIFDNNVGYYIACTAVNNKVLIAYQDAGDSYKGKFVIYDENGNIIKSETEFEGGNTSDISCTTINGKIIIVYRDYTDWKKGKFVIVDENGTILTSADPNQPIFDESAIQYTSCTTVNNKAFIAYQDDGHADKGKFVIVDENGTILTSADPNQPIFEEGTTTDISCTTISGKVLIAYKDVADGNKGKFVIYDENGNELVSSTIFKNTTLFDIACTNVNNKALITYRDIGDLNKGKFVIYNDSGIEVGAQTIFNDCFVSDIVCTTIDDKVIVVFRDNDDSGKGKFVIYNEDAHYYYYIEKTWDEDKYISEARLVDIDDNIVYVTIDFPEIYLQKDDKLYSIIDIKQTI